MKRISTLLWVLTIPVLLSACFKNLPSQSTGTPESTKTREEILTEQMAAAQTTTPGAGEATLTVGEGTGISSGTTPIPSGVTYGDPWDYCQATGSISEPGAEYTGAQPHPGITASILQAMGMDTETAASGSFSVIWRCMDSQVWGCDVSSYPNCPNPVDFSTEPSDIMKQECAKAELDNVVLPSAVTGRDTAYEWTCRNGIPEISGQGVSADAYGFNASIWLPVMRQ